MKVRIILVFKNLCNKKEVLWMILEISNSFVFIVLLILIVHRLKEG